MEEATRHIQVALRLYEAASFGTIPPQVGNAIIWANRDGEQSEALLRALDQGLQLLDEAKE
jgi:hypothetical protein